MGFWLVRLFYIFCSSKVTCEMSSTYSISPTGRGLHWLGNAHLASWIPVCVLLWCFGDIILWCVVVTSGMLPSRHFLCNQNRAREWYGRGWKRGMRNKCKNGKVGLCSLSMPSPLVAVSGNPSPSPYTANRPSTATRLVMNLIQDPEISENLPFHPPLHWH